jgi:sugar transferase (PEP-CTERM system associated)
VFRHHISRLSLLLAIGEAMLFFCLIVFFASANKPGRWIGLSQPFPDLSNIIIFAAGVVVVTELVMGATGLYNLDIMLEMDAVLARMALSFSLAFAAFCCVDLVLSRWAISYSTQYKAAAVAIPACAVASLIVRGLLGHLAKRKNLRRGILVVGCGRSAAKIARMNSVDRFRFRVVGYVDFGGADDGLALEPLFPSSSLASPEAATALVASRSVDRIVIASDERRGLPHAALLQCRMMGIRIEDFTTFWERHAGHVDLDSLQPSWLIYSDGFSMNRDGLFTKIFFDYAVASLLLLVTAPISLLTALLIKTTSKGPVFFRQERVGRNGKIFNVLKFRSMAVDAEKSGPQWAKANDSRVTGVGRFIRKVRIDEIPQAINILKGEMSFVGPRPERPHFVRQLTEAIPYFDERHRVKPGLSGWAQINYPYGASIEDARNKLSYDLYYLKNASIFLDFVILLRTVHVILWPYGAR